MADPSALSADQHHNAVEVYTLLDAFLQTCLDRFPGITYGALDVALEKFLHDFHHNAARSQWQPTTVLTTRALGAF